MKKLSILILSILFITTTSLTAQTDANKETTSNTEQVKEECPSTKNAAGKLVCVKTGKACESTCEKKKTKSCCKGKKTKTTCNKSKKGSFNFNKSNNYGGVKSSCNKTKKKSCSKKETSSDSDEETDSTKEETDSTESKE